MANNLLVLDEDITTKGTQPEIEEENTSQDWK